MQEQFRYFGDYHIGQAGQTARRTVFEADAINFAYLQGDYGRNLMDVPYMVQSAYGWVVPHGVMGISLATGSLSLWAPHILGRGVPGAYFYGFEVNYRGSIMIGDTIAVQWRVAEKASNSIYKGFGLVKTAFQIVNQKDIPVYDGTLSTLVRKKSAQNMRLEFKAGESWPVREFPPDPQKAYYAEDYIIGGGGETDGRTITETDIVNFAGLTGDLSPQYIDAESARQSQFGERLAPGMLVFGSAFGLWSCDYYRYRRPEGTSVAAGHLSDKGTFLVPVKIGDTIRSRYKILASRASKSRPELGIVTFGLQVVNQGNEVVQEGSIIVLLPSRGRSSD